MINLEKIVRLFNSITNLSILRANKISHGRVIEKLDDLNFTLMSINESPLQSLSLYMIDDKEFSNFMAGEANRFFLASMISLDRSKSNEFENIAWQVVEHYYSAYYAVHYLMRVVGFSITNINKKSLDYIVKTNLTDSSANNLKCGLHLMQYDTNCTTITLSKKDKSGGSHIDAWELWSKIIKTLILKTESDIREYADISVLLIQHHDFILRKNNTFSPTVIRNEINYQFVNDAWCFNGLTKIKSQKIKKIISNDSICFTENSKDPVVNLIYNNNLIISLAKIIFENAYKNHSKGIGRSLHNKYKNKIKSLQCKE